jgi:hypothetical protein
MPFMVEADVAARSIADGLQVNRPEIVFPLPMAVGIKLLQLLPHNLWNLVWKRQSSLKRRPGT